MSRRRLYIGVVALCAAVFVGFLITYLCEHPPLLYYKQQIGWHELPSRLIRPAFRYISSKDLPPRADGLRALFQGGREPRIFVRLNTNSEGIAYILEAFGASAKSETFDEDKVRFMNTNRVEIFPTLSLVQQSAGVVLLDQDSVKSGRTLTGCFDPPNGPEYRIFIEDPNSTAYISAGLK